MDAVRRLTLALHLALVAALDASADDVLDEDGGSASGETAASSDVPLRFVARTVYDELRCTERSLAATPVSLAGLVRRP